MGNSSARSSDLLIYIETEKQYYNSGSHIEGVVFVEAKKNFLFDALYIRVEGDEWGQWFEGSSKNRQKHTGSENFYAVEHVLERYERHGGTLQKGLYAYPFSVELSENIPGSFQSREYDTRIEYKLAAYFVNFKQQNNTEIQYIPLHIRQPFRQEMVSYQGTSQQQPKTCCCISKGQVTLYAKFDRNVCYDGESINIETRVDNTQGTGDIDTVSVDLVQNLFVSSNSGTHRTYSDSLHHDNVRVGVKKGEVKSVTHSFKVNAKNSQTAIGTLVANHYRIEVSTKAGAISSNNPCVYSPLFILKEKGFDIKNVSRPHGMSANLCDYQLKKQQIFRAPEYWFKKNLNLSVMNFRLEDGVEPQ